VCWLLAFQSAWLKQFEGMIVLDLSVFPIKFVSVYLSFHHKRAGSRSLLRTCIHDRALWYQLPAEVVPPVLLSLLFLVYRTPRLYHITC
jgi:hypothetical protein